MKILVLSCDNNEDLWEPFHHCIEKYWPEHPEVIYSTETKANPYYKTICVNYDIDSWSFRVKTCLKIIKDKQVLIMVDDIFIRDYVNNNKINKLSIDFPINAAAINLEKSFDKKDTYYSELLKKRYNNGEYKTSVMCGLWDREKAINVFNIKLSPWEFEMNNHHCNYDYYILNDYAFNWGHYRNGDIWAVYRGKWCKEVVPFFEKENIKVNYTKRGFCD